MSLIQHNQDNTSTVVTTLPFHYTNSLNTTPLELPPPPQTTDTSIAPTTVSTISAHSGNVGQAFGNVGQAFGHPPRWFLKIGIMQFSILQHSRIKTNNCIGTISNFILLCIKILVS